MKSISTSLDHPIIFVLDRACDQLLATEIDDDRTVGSDGICVAIRARVYFDGGVEVICDTIPGDVIISDGKMVFCGSIKSESGVLSVITADDETLIELECSTPEATICVVVDSERHPGKIWIMSMLELTYPA